MTKEQSYEEAMTLLKQIKDKGLLSDYCFYSFFQYSYINAIVNKQVRSDTGKIRKPNFDTSNDIIKTAKRFLKKVQ